MPAAYTHDELMLALAREAYSGEQVIDISTTTAETTAGTSALFGELAWGASGATTTAYHNTYLYLRRFSGLATAGGASTITLRTSMGDLGAANVLANWKIKITAGTSSGDERTISSNTDANPTVVTVDSAWTATPTTTSFYEIYPSSSAIDRPNRTSRALTTGSFTVATGVVTCAPAFAGNAAAALSIGIGADFLFCKDNPKVLRNAINRVLNGLRFYSYLPPTLVTDGDLEDTGVTNWAAIGSPTTREKTSTSYPFQFGRQALHIVTAALDTGATSNNVPVGDEEVLTLGVPIKVVSGTVDVILYRSTATATALKTVTVSDIEPVIVWFQQSPTSGTKNVTVRFESATASSEWYVGPVMLLSQSRNRYPLDTSSVVRASDVRGLYTLRPGQQVETDVYLLSNRLEPLAREVERDDRGNLINVVASYPYYPMLMQAYQRWPSLTYDTDTTYADKDTVVQGAMYYIETARKNQTSDPAQKAEHARNARTYLANFFRMSGIDPVELAGQETRRVIVRFP